MYKFAGYIIRQPGTGRYLDVFFDQRSKAEEFCRANHIAPDHIKQVSIYETN